MCTVTYIPKQDQGYFMTHNRDESFRRRVAVPPMVRDVNGIKCLFPVDRSGGGTWMAVSEDNRSMAILNGPVRKSKAQLTAKHSRGLVVLDYLAEKDLKAFVKNYDFQGIEPFDALVRESGELFMLRWRHDEVSVESLNVAIPYIFSSASLYNGDVALKRKKWFHDFLRSNENLNPKKILDFHRYTGRDDPEASLVISERKLISTVSITQLNITGETAEFRYIDLLNDITLNKSLDLEAVAMNESLN